MASGRVPKTKSSLRGECTIQDDSGLRGDSTDAQIFERVRSIAADVLQVNQKSLSGESSPQSIETWDSVNHLNLVLAVEEQFGLQFEPEEMDGMKSIGDIAGLVARKSGG